MTNINSRAAALIDNDGWKTASNNRRHRRNKRINETSKKSEKSEKSENLTNSKEININIESNKEFPEFIVSKKKLSKLEKKMNYLGVASHEITLKKEEAVKDGWLRIKKDKSGFVSKTYGKNNNSLQIQQQMENRNNNEIFRNIIARHNNYKLSDQENYFTNYKFSWETYSESDTMSDGFSDNCDDGDENFYDEDDEFNPDY